MYYYLYKITNLTNGKIYIGVHRTYDINDGYMGSGHKLQEAQKKYGKENFKKDILKYFDSEEEMGEDEAEVVNENFIKREDTYNITCGGRGIDYECCKKGREATDKILYEKYGENGREELSKKGIEALEEKYGENGRKEMNKLLEEKCGKNGKKEMDKALKEKYPEGVGKDRKHDEESKRKIGEANSEHQKGSGNSQYGTMWIYNPELKQNKKIKKDEEIPEGGYKGRKIKFD